MEKKILEDVGRSERKQTLKDSCYGLQEFTYHKGFTDDEITIQKDTLVQEDIKLEKLMSEKKEKVAEFNANIKIAKQERFAVLNNVRTGMEEVTEQVYLLDDQDEQRMGYYNDMGDLVYQRPLKPEERQLRIIDSTGTGN